MTIKRICKMIGVIALLAAILFTLSGCSEPEPINLAVVAEVANNNPLFEGVPELYDLQDAPESTYSIVLASSEPSMLIEDEVVPSFKGKGYTKVMLDKFRASILTDLNNRISEAAPSAPEVDIAASTTLALRKLHAHMADNDATQMHSILVFYGSMLSTSGLIDFTQNPVYALDVDASVAKLLPQLNWDMHNIDVVIYCCGDTAGNQPKFSAAEVTTLKSFYEILFYAAGADDVVFKDDTAPDGSYDFDQPVSIVQTEEIVCGLQQIVLEDNEDVSSGLNDGKILAFPLIAFEPDSAELEDPEAVSRMLAGVVNYMNSNPDFELLLCATTSSFGEKDSSITFSQSRADTVAGLLCDAGIDPIRIHSLGCGWSSSLYIPDRDAQGELDEAIAPQNRMVQLVDFNSPAAAAIMDSLASQTAMGSR